MNKAIYLLATYFLHTTLSALTFGDFEYDLINSDTEVEITAYNGSDLDLTVPDTIDDKPVTSIGETVFESTDIETITLPESLTNIADYAFADSGLTGIVLPNSIITIGESAFEDCYQLVNITLSENLLTIGIGCFAGTVINHLILPEGLVSIGIDAFDSTRLTTIRIPPNVTTIGSAAFGFCDDLLSIEVDVSNQHYSSDEGVLLNKNATVLYQCPQTKTGNYNVPSTVTTIEAYAFFNTTLLTEITLPSSLKTIGRDAFADSGITSMTIPNGVTTLENYTFSSCVDLSSIKLSENLEAIGISCFSNCSSLSTIILSQTITSIADRAFSSCTSLIRINLPDGITTIEKSTFTDCFNIEQVQLPAALITIEGSAFYNCKKLTRVVFPAGLTLIDQAAFNDADDLVPVLLGDAPTAGSNIFQRSSFDTVYYMSGATGFGSTWENKQAVVLDPASFDIASAWLLEHGLNYDADVSQDLNGDGVSLLMAYALNLDPNQNLAAEMPAISLGDGTTSLVYFGNNEDVSYEVEASTDLVDWDNIAVNYSDLDGEWMRTASVSSAEFSKLFLRLRVSKE